MASSLIDAVRRLRKAVCCQNYYCRKYDVDLQLLGNECRHPYCRSCANMFKAKGKENCVHCNARFDFSHPHRAHRLNEIMRALAELQDILQRHTGRVGCSDLVPYNNLAALSEPREPEPAHPQKRFFGQHDTEIRGRSTASHAKRVLLGIPNKAEEEIRRRKSTQRSSTVPGTLVRETVTATKERTENHSVRHDITDLLANLLEAYHAELSQTEQSQPQEQIFGQNEKENRGWPRPASQVRTKDDEIGCLKHTRSVEFSDLVTHQNLAPVSDPPEAEQAPPQEKIFEQNETESREEAADTEAIAMGEGGGELFDVGELNHHSPPNEKETRASRRRSIPTPVTPARATVARNRTKSAMAGSQIKWNEKEPDENENELRKSRRRAMPSPVTPSIVRKSAITGSHSNPRQSETDQDQGSLLSPTRNSASKRNLSVLAKDPCALLNAVLRKDKRKLEEALKDEYVNVNERDPLGCSPLFLAAERNLPDFCALLIDAGAVVNSYCTSSWSTPLHIASQVGATEAARLLLSRGADRLAMNAAGRQPEELAKTAAIASLIKRAKAGPLRIVQPKAEEPRFFFATEIPNTTKKLAKGLDDVQVVASFSKCTHYIMDTEQSTPANMEEANELAKNFGGSREKRTAKLTGQLLEAILQGRFVISSEWLKNDAALDEAVLFEVTHIKGGEGVYEAGCQAARKNHEAMMPPLFTGFQFMLSLNNYGEYKKSEIASLIKNGGGTVLARNPNGEICPPPFHARQLASPFFILYDPAQKLPRSSGRTVMLLSTHDWFVGCITCFSIKKPD